MSKGEREGERTGEVGADRIVFHSVPIFSSLSRALLYLFSALPFCIAAQICYVPCKLCAISSCALHIMNGCEWECDGCLSDLSCMSLCAEQCQMRAPPLSVVQSLYRR